MSGVPVEEVERLLKLATKYGLKSLTLGNVSFTFLDPTSRETQPTEIPTLGEKMPPDDEMMFFSSDSAIQVPNPS